MLIGNVGNEPEIRTTGAGVKVAKFSLATSRTWNDRSGQKQEKTEWHRVTAWDRLAGIVEEYVGKGHRLYVEGAIEYSETEGEDGKPRYWTDINAKEIVMLDSREKAAATTPSTPKANPFDADDGDLPF
jgi:single-strand DNA-binding protein